MKKHKSIPLFLSINAVIVLLCIPILTLCTTSAVYSNTDTERQNEEWQSDDINVNRTQPDNAEGAADNDVSLTKSIEDDTTSPSALGTTEAGTSEGIAPEETTYEDSLSESKEFSLPLELLRNINDTRTAVYAVRTAIRGIGDEIDSKAAETLALYAEEAIARSSSRRAGSDISIDRLIITPMEEDANYSRSAIESILNQEDITLYRDLRSTLVFSLDKSDEYAIEIDPSVASIGADYLRIEMPEYSLSIPNSFVRQSTGNIEINIQTAPDHQTVEITFSGKTQSSLILSMPYANIFDTVYDENGVNYGGQINTINKTIDARISSSGNYTVQANKSSFKDLDGLSETRRNAILYLASRGIISGFSETEFAPNNQISRAQIAMLIAKACEYYDEKADGGFIDVKSYDWFYHAAGSVKKQGIMVGTNVEGTFFSPSLDIPRVQMVCIAARVLRKEMRLREVADADEVLSSYADKASIPKWSVKDVALVKRLGILDTRLWFEPDYRITRGEAAELLRSMYDKIWLK